MSSERTIAFTSDKFLPFLPEACQENPGVYGFELALWLSRNLMGQRIATSYPIGEDWGWFIEYITGDIECMIACSSVSDEGEGYQLRPIGWRVVVSERTSRGLFFRRKSRGAESETVARLADAIAQLLTAEGIAVEASGTGDV